MLLNMVETVKLKKLLPPKSIPHYLIPTPIPHQTSKTLFKKKWQYGLKEHLFTFFKHDVTCCYFYNQLE